MSNHPLPPAPLAIDIITAPTPETLNSLYITPGKPVLIRGVTDHWPARWKWSHEYFAKHAGHTTVTVSRQRGRDAQDMLLATYLKYLECTQEADPLYLCNWIFERNCPQLLNDYEALDLFERLEAKLPENLRPQWRWMFIGPAGSGTHLHVDVLDTSAWNVVITGRKRWRFYSPDQQALMYQGHVNTFEPDLTAHPLFAQAQAIECVQQPGDLVFTPSGWWHQVLNERGGISITENFIDRANLERVKQAAQRANLAYLDQAVAAIG
ncbi:cupin-like domain-containing protein [Pseudomonas sp. RHF3.3-3]|uniref:Cupin-like domain n=1 Tax=Pseudomonas asplenii TaxID=53407 RepID=A0A0N0E3N3_9PSED|nr:cupin-like domain-containing protein [Pseudomonas fuscovaginae]KPA90318.1 Cupin-like domain [Pseudomonas fuscovaginae]